MQFHQYITLENIYLWSNFGILPFWLILLVIPNSKVTQFFLNSIIIPLIITCAYSYIVYQSFLLENSLIDLFKIYLSIENLYTAFATESFLLIFWLHFLALNIFLGSWISLDGVKYNIPRGVVALPLILVYLTGPLGLVLYWLIRVFYAKKIGFHN